MRTEPRRHRAKSRSPGCGCAIPIVLATAVIGNRQKGDCVKVSEAIDSAGSVPAYVLSKSKPDAGARPFYHVGSPVGEPVTIYDNKNPNDTFKVKQGELVIANGIRKADGTKFVEVAGYTKGDAVCVLPGDWEAVLSVNGTEPSIGFSEVVDNSEVSAKIMPQRPESVDVSWCEPANRPNYSSMEDVPYADFFRGAAKESAARHGLDEKKLFYSALAIGQLESGLQQYFGGDPSRGVKDNGYGRGIMQLTGRQYSVMDDPEQNIYSGVEELATRLSDFDGDLASAALAYNAGKTGAREIISGLGGQDSWKTKAEGGSGLYVPVLAPYDQANLTKVQIAICEAERATSYFNDFAALP
jgi:hypothetical protein